MVVDDIEGSLPDLDGCVRAMDGLVGRWCRREGEKMVLDVGASEISLPLLVDGEHQEYSSCKVDDHLLRDLLRPLLLVDVDLSNEVIICQRVVSQNDLVLWP